jgi:hypothetical protein
MASVHTGLIAHLYRPVPGRYGYIPRQQAGQYSADSGDTPVGDSSSSAPDQTNYTPTSTDPGSIASAASSLLGDLFGSGGGSSSTTSASSSSSSSSSNVIAPGGDTGPTVVGPSGGGGGSAPTQAPTTPSSAIIPAATSSSHSLLWWIIGGVAAVTVIIIGWRLFGHKGATTAAKGAAKAAAFYGVW